MAGFFDTKIEFLKGVGPQKGGLFNKEINIFTFGDLIQYFPFRYEDRTRFSRISELRGVDKSIQLKGTITQITTQGHQRKKRLVGLFSDGSGYIELIWFQGLQWIVKKVNPGTEYVLYGKLSVFMGKLVIVHPELEIFTPSHLTKLGLSPVYPLTEGLKSKYIDSKYISKCMHALLNQSMPYIRETLPDSIRQELALIPKNEAVWHIHFPTGTQELQRAQYRLKFDELFYLQLRILKLKLGRTEKFRGMVIDQTSLLTEFYNKHLPFQLTDAQKRVIREIFQDLKSGHQMNRLIQGDVGSGKTIVAFLSMLLAIGSGAQTSIMAPTEILAEQHYRGLKPLAKNVGLKIALLTGSTKQKDRKIIHQALENGTIDILVGTHALLEDTVKFSNLGLAVIDEQHRFGVAQRAKLWKKNEAFYPHILVMTATPIPRTLAMTVYGDLDVSKIDELPKGRKPIQTFHKFDSHRLWVFGFMRKQIELGRQVYVVYPLIEESENLDLKHLTDGYEAICRAFPEYAVSIVHGKMKAADKDFEMQRFIEHKTQIMVATTVIEVGVNVPNASVMVIENAERFGLAQLHQLRGRVGRGADQSYCILMTSFKLSKEGKERIQTMVKTNDGFEIAEADLRLRGPGDMMGTRQSGIMDLLIADIARDSRILQIAREKASEILGKDPELTLPQHQMIRQQVESAKPETLNWSKIS